MTKALFLIDLAFYNAYLASTKWHRTMKRCVPYFLTFIAALLLGYHVGTRHRGPAVEIHDTDTLIITKTVTEFLPAPKSIEFTRWAFFTETDTLNTVEYIPYAVNDTIFVPISQSYYERLDGRLRLWISGFDTSLDKFELDENYTHITHTIHKKWSWSVGAGPAIIYTPFHSNHIDAGIGLFGGVTYNF